MAKRLRKVLLWAAVSLASQGTDGSSMLAADVPKSGSGALAYEEPKYLTGLIYSQESEPQKLLFKFKRVASRSGSTLKVQRDFTYPDGKLAAQERVVYEGDSLILYQLDELQSGASGSAKIRHSDHGARGTIEFEFAKEKGARSRTRTEDLAENTLISDMVGPFLAAHWDGLRRGEQVRCRMIVVPRRETVGFTFLKQSETTWRGQEVVTVRMEATSAILGALVDPLFFTIQKAPPHRVLQYVGRTTPKIRAGGKWKDLDAVTVFDWAPAQ